MGHKDVLLIVPPLYQSGREPDYNPKEPMGIMYVGASLREAGISTELLDADVHAMTIPDTVNAIAEKKPLIVGLSSFQRALPSLELMVTQLRDAGYSGHITCGGITPSLSYPLILQRLKGKLDSIVVGDGEKTMVDLSESVINGKPWQQTRGIAWSNNGSIVLNSPNDPIDLDTLPFASRDLFETCYQKTNYATILGSRDCYGRCTFCSNSAFAELRGGAKWRGRDPESVVNEMQALYEEHGVDVFKFNDPNIFGPGRRGRQHVIDLAKLLKERNLNFHLMGFCRGNDLTAEPEILSELKDAGFERLLIGVESSDNHVLGREAFQKDETREEMEKALDLLSRAGISTVVGFMIYNPYTTLDTLKGDLDFLDRRKLTPTLSKALRIFDGTQLQQKMEAEGRLKWRNPFEGYHDYIVPRDVATTYGVLKKIFTNCLDPIRAKFQNNIWNIKKAPSFRDRQDFNSLAEFTYRIESGLLRTTIGWIENGDWTKDDISTYIEQMYEKFFQLDHRLGLDPDSVQKVMVPVVKTADDIHDILKRKPYETLHEEYRWNKD